MATTKTISATLSGYKNVKGGSNVNLSVTGLSVTGDYAISKTKALTSA